jgi:dihydrofolate synthase/folylpolyglutamate synthase
MDRQKNTPYQQALNYLYSFIDYEKHPPSSRRAAQHNLARTRALLAAVGNPQEQFASVVAAGTKGKGSTCAMLESMLRAAGYRTGLWTSPHLNSYRERIQVDRQLISQQAVIEGVERLRPVVAAFDSERYGAPTTFELGFALALCYFAEQQAQVAVLEVGLGGRYDCANAVTPLLSLISSISYDHTKQLGNTLGEIAYQKAGILKNGVSAITVPQHPDAMATLKQVAAEVGTQPFWRADTAGMRELNTEPNAPMLHYPVDPLPALRGPFQRENARLAVAAAWQLRAQGWSISAEALRDGLAAVHWPGRMEVAGQSPLIVLDGAHNGDSAHKLAAALATEFQFERLLLVLGMSHDKPFETILSALVPQASALVLTRSRHPRAHVDLDKIAAVARPMLRGELRFTGDIPEALEQAQALARPGDLICVTGSLFVVGAARETLGIAAVCD